jgi:hypothetical protein
VRSPDGGDAAPNLSRHPLPRSPSVGRRFFETARHDNRIKFARAQNRHDRGAGSRPANARAGRRVEYLSITWTSLEAIIGATVGILAGSVALIGKARLIAIVRPIDWSAPAFFALAAYIAIDASADLLRHEAPRVTYFGILYAGACVVVMPLLARAKRRVAVRLNSNALHADSHQSDICAYLSVILLLRLALNAALGWWWADPIAALAMLTIIIREGIAGWCGKTCSHAHF